MYVVAQDALINCQANRASGGRGPMDAVKRALGVWRDRMRERQALSLLEERDVRDLGLSRYDVQRELAKPFWRG